ncbi:hypothetical protein PS850_04793 [Pseudomonas fluorescens]|nr:hypothetical protein PS850_04793 [Pseudomonas fluorescens]
MNEIDEYGNLECVTVFTCRGKDRILRERGSQSWRINMSRASKCKYVVCVQNRNETWGQATADHKTAFLIGKISSIEPSKEKGCADRAIINISEYAEISIPNCWDGNRNPIAYRRLADFGIRNFADFEDLPFCRLGIRFNLLGDDQEQPEMPGDDYEAISRDEEIPIPANDETVMSLSIDEAKKGLARRFGVSIEQIDITIRG